MLSPKQVLDHDFLETRCQLLEVAAMLDRHDFAGHASGNGHASGSDTSDDPRLRKLYDALALLAEPTAADGKPSRAEQLLNLFT